jgi:uncharacterized membrane protein YkvA (DUF1232 family)
VPVTDARPPRTLRTTVHALLTELFDVVVQGARLWGRHWPLLLAIALLGGAVRMGAIWAATAASANNNTLGFAILMVAPLGSVASIILMLHVMRGSLPRLTAASAVPAQLDPTTHRERRLLDLLASVLVPFLAVYASYGYLREDRQRFANAAAAQEYTENSDILVSGADAIYSERFVVASGWVVIAIVIVAIVLRWGLARLEGKVHATPLGFVGAYVEVFWMAVLAVELTVQREKIWAWAESRRALDIVLGWWADLLEAIGPLAGPVDAVVDWAAGLIGNLDDLVVVPLAWLAVGAVVFGHKLTPRPLRTPRPARLERVPGPVRRWVTQATQPVVGDLRVRFMGLVNGIRQLAVAGLAPMLVFGLAFLASTRLEDLLALGIRSLVGPQPVDTWLAFSQHIDTVTRAIGLTVTMALLAAAIDRVLDRDRQAAAAASDDTASDDTASGDEVVQPA